MKILAMRLMMGALSNMLRAMIIKMALMSIMFMRGWRRIIFMRETI